MKVELLVEHKKVRIYLKLLEFQDIDPSDLPPILPNIVQQLKEYIICPERLPIHQYENNQEFWPCEKDVSRIFEIHRNQQLGTNLMVIIDIEIQPLAHTNS